MNLKRHFVLYNQYKEITRISRYEVHCKSPMTASTTIIMQYVLSSRLYHNAVQKEPDMLEDHTTSIFQVKEQCAKDNSLSLLGFQPGNLQLHHFRAFISNLLVHMCKDKSAHTHAHIHTHA